MTITEVIALGNLGLMAIAATLETIDYWLGEKISEAIKEWWNK